MYTVETIETPLNNLTRLTGSSGRVVFSSLKKWHNRNVFRDISIKYVLKGTEYYFDSNRVKYRVDQGQFLLGAFQQDSGECIVDSSASVEGICLYIKPELLSDIHAVLSNKNKYDLDAFSFSHLSYPEFFNHIFAGRHSPLQAQLSKCASWYYFRDSVIPEELFNEFIVETAEKIVLLQFGIHESMTRLNFLKKATRREILRRLITAREYMEENYLLNPSLEEISFYSSLSKYHLLRCFKLAYRQTPFEYVQNKRLVHAKTALQNKEAELKDIARLCSFSDLASFSKAFKRKFGMPPSIVQKQVQPVYSFNG
ncbi:MAG: helix-turn-helix transcriptional regulator [Chitinophagaceae bacterium]|nr:helix-turn-helix transcriptional regulator [Chitinophagaceae bacterium]